MYVYLHVFHNLNFAFPYVTSNTFRSIIRNFSLSFFLRMPPPSVAHVHVTPTYNVNINTNINTKSSSSTPMQLTRRRSKAVPNGSVHSIRTTHSYLQPERQFSRAILLFPLIILACLIFVLPPLFQNATTRKRPNILLSSTTGPDDEQSISLGRLPFEDSTPARFEENMIACMPTVSRGGIEYVSNAIKSWRLATNSSTSIRRLIVFDMDVQDDDDDDEHKTNHQSSLPIWVNRIFSKKHITLDQLPSWLEIRKRSIDMNLNESIIQQPRQQTLGDSKQRVAWRSKEAQDYANVLNRCIQLSPKSAKYVFIVQDDVLFTTNIKRIVQWSQLTLIDREYTTEEIEQHKHQNNMLLKGRMQRICSGSLFDILPSPLPSSSIHIKDGHIQYASNMVARIWTLSFGHRVVKYIQRNFDEKPVDWLIDEMCRTARRVNLVMQPNGVRHRGAVSSFSQNKRQGLLT